MFFLFCFSAKGLRRYVYHWPFVIIYKIIIIIIFVILVAAAGCRSNVTLLFDQFEIKNIGCIFHHNYPAGKKSFRVISQCYRLEPVRPSTQSPVHAELSSNSQANENLTGITPRLSVNCCRTLYVPCTLSASLVLLAFKQIACSWPNQWFIHMFLALLIPIRLALHYFSLHQMGEHWYSNIYWSSLDWSHPMFSSYMCPCSRTIRLSYIYCVCTSAISISDEYTEFTAKWFYDGAKHFNIGRFSCLSQ